MSTISTYSGVAQWQNDNEVSACPICTNKFNLLFRKHHCRMCGRVVCGNCSQQFEKYLPTSYVVAPPNQPFLESPHRPHRTCSECSEELAMIRRALSLSPSHSSRQLLNTGDSAASNTHSVMSAESRAMMVQNVSPGADNDYLGRCPVCDKQLFSMPQKMQEKHIDECLVAYTASPDTLKTGPQRKRMLISRLSAKTSSALGDCSICYEEFEPGQTVGRLECMCVFHDKCILEWFRRKGAGSCPLHNHSD